MKNIILLLTFLTVYWVSEAQNVFPASGNVGIGTTSPAYPLDVIGDSRVTGKEYIANGELDLTSGGSTSDPYGYISVTLPADGNSYSYYGLTRAGNLGLGMGITSSNQFFIGGSTDNSVHTLSGWWFY